MVKERPALKRKSTLFDAISEGSLTKVGKTGKKLFNLERSLGIPNKLLHHVWNIFMMCLAIWLYVLYYTQTFGHYNVRRGLLTMPSIIIP